MPLTPSLLGMDPASLKEGSRAAKLQKAARDFEALMIGEMLKTTRQEGADGWMGSGDGSAANSAMGLGETQLALAIARGGGFGLAQLIEKQLARPGDRTESDQNKNASSGVPAAGSAK
jgi:Rod binding domain-containing protein